MKRFYSYLMVMVLLLFCGGRVMAQSVTMDDITYTLVGGEVSVSAADKSIVAAEIRPTVLIGGSEYPVRKIAERAFSACVNLTSVAIPEGVTTIGCTAFVGCSSLTSITLPESVTTIGSSVFSGCTALASITLPKSVSAIGSMTFANCSSLTSVVLPEGLPTIEYGLFAGCISLTSVIIPKSVTSIRKHAFSDCSSLPSVVIPAGVASIGEEAFFRCHSLTSFTCCGEFPPKLEDDVFERVDISTNCTLYVYSEYVDNYKGLYPWDGGFAAVETLFGNVIYMVDGEVYFTEQVASNDSLILIDDPTKEGHTFSGWSDAPAIMPIGDVILSGTFTPNIYKITYMVKGEVHHTDSVTFGSTLTPPPLVGGFTSWIGLPQTMPAHDVIVYGDGYRLTYMVDGVIYNDSICMSGSVITPLAAPVKEGHTFSGWSEIPPTMPAGDVVVSGSFSINSYKLTYMVDGKVYHTDTLVYATELVPIEEPVRVGSSFSGWSEIPATMPANDVIVTGSFTVNTYKLSYIIDGEVYHTDMVLYGAAIPPMADPTKEGHSFEGWSEIPEIMPAEDVTILGSFSVNTYQITYIVEGEVYHTDSIVYGEPIPPIEKPVKEGYALSGWENIPETMPAYDVTIIGIFILADKHSDEQGLTYELNATRDAFEVSGYTDDLVPDVVIPTEFYGLPVNAIQPRALAFTLNLQSLVIPSSIKSVGINSLGGNETLLTVEWNTTAPVDAECFSRPSNYGNMLVYVPDASTEVTFQGNVVVDGVIDQLTLIDELPFRNIHEFTARSITYTRDFDKQNSIGVSSGWEGLVIPFDVQRVESKEKGELKPFGEADFTTSLPYWLGDLQPDGTFVITQGITANKPFIMLLPNSDEYEDCYNVAGEVIFSAENVTVHTTLDVEQAKGGGYSLLGSYEGTAANSRIYALNEEEYTADNVTYKSCGIFVANSRDIRPFEAYVYNGQVAYAPYLRIADEESTGLGQVTIHHSPFTGAYDLMGRRVDSPTKGIYIVNGKKTIKR